MSSKPSSKIRVLDLYVALHRALSIEMPLIIQLRRKNVMHGLNLDEATGFIREMQEAFGVTVGVELICEFGLKRCRQALTHQENRLAYICSSCPGELTTQGASRIIKQEPWTLFLDNMILMSCLGNLEHLISDAKRRAQFLALFPAYFRISPTKITGMLAERGKSFPQDLLELKDVLTPLLPQVPRVRSLPPKASPKPKMERPNRQVIESLPEGRRLLDRLDALGFMTHQATVAVSRLQKDCGSAENGLVLINELHEAGWHRRELAELCRLPYIEARAAGAIQLIAYQVALEFAGVKRPETISFICERFSKLPSPEELVQRITTACLSSDPDLRTGLISDAPRALLDFSVEELKSRREGWNARGKNVSKEPKLLLRMPEERTKVNPDAPRNVAYESEASRGIPTERPLLPTKVIALIVTAPELAKESRTVLTIVEAFMDSYHQTSESVCESLKSQEQRAILLRPPREISQRINGLRRLNLPTKLGAPADLLDFRFDWTRLLFPIDILQKRLDQLEPDAGMLKRYLAFLASQKTGEHIAVLDDEEEGDEGDDDEVEEEEHSPGEREQRYQLYAPLVRILFLKSEIEFQNELQKLLMDAI